MSIEQRPDAALIEGTIAESGDVADSQVAHLVHTHSREALHTEKDDSPLTESPQPLVKSGESHHPDATRSLSPEAPDDALENTTDSSSSLPVAPPSEAPPAWLRQVLHEQAAMLAPVVPSGIPDNSGAQPDEALPDWLQQVLKAQVAMLAPAQPTALPHMSVGATGPLETGYYDAWLDHESQRRTSPYSKSAWRGFLERIHRTQRTSGAAQMPFATIDRATSAVTTVTAGQAIVFMVLAAGVVVGLYTIGPMMLTLLLGGITLAYLVNLLLTAILAANVIDQAPEESVPLTMIQQLDDVLWPPYTVLCPLYREVAVIPQFVAAMRALDYPQDRLQVLLLTECDDEATREALRSMDLPPSFEVVTVPDGLPRTKPRACNYGLLLAKGSFTVIYDAEDVPDPLQLKQAVLAFANHSASLACVQAKLGFYNTHQNVLTRWFAIEYALWFHLTLPGLQWARLSLPLGGTSNHFRTDILRRLGGWDAYNVTEDCDLGLRLAEHHLYTTILDSTTLEEANSNVRNWVRQRSRWIKGYMQTYLVHLRRPWDYILRRRFRALFSLLVIIGGTPATFIINPLMWVLLGLYVAERQTLTPEFHLLYAAPIFSPAVICLIAGNFLYLYLCLVACAKSGQYGLLPWVFTIPICWVLMCIAATLAAFQLLVKPHHWEKTNHGLHLPRQAAKDVPVAEPVGAVMVQLQARTKNWAGE